MILSPERAPHRRSRKDIASRVVINDISTKGKDYSILILVLGGDDSTSVKDRAKFDPSLIGRLVCKHIVTDDLGVGGIRSGMHGSIGSSTSSVARVPAGIGSASIARDSSASRV